MPDVLRPLRDCARRRLDCSRLRPLRRVRREVHRYEQVPAEVVQALLEADSMGRYFNQVFKPQHYRYQRIG